MKTAYKRIITYLGLKKIRHSDKMIAEIRISINGLLKQFNGYWLFIAGDAGYLLRFLYVNFGMTTFFLFYLVIKPEEWDLMPLWHKPHRRNPFRISLYVHTYIYRFFSANYTDNPSFWYIICIN